MNDDLFWWSAIAFMIVFGLYYVWAGINGVLKRKTTYLSPVRGPGLSKRIRIEGDVAFSVGWVLLLAGGLCVIVPIIVAVMRLR